MNTTSSIALAVTTIAAVAGGGLDRIRPWLVDVAYLIGLIAAVVLVPATDSTVARFAGVLLAVGPALLLGGKHLGSGVSPQTPPADPVRELAQ